MKISFVRLSIDSLGALAKRMLEISAKAAYTVVLNHPLLQALVVAYNDFFAVFDKKTYSGFGKQVAAADLIRDDAFKGMRNSLLGLTKMTGLSTLQAAIDLYAIFETHGLDLNRYSYGDQTTHMDKLIEDMDKPVNVAKIEQVHLTESYGLMKTAHLNFVALFGEQMGANTELRLQESASSLRGNLESAMRNYLSVVTAMKDITAWKELYVELNEAVKAAKNSINPGKEDTPAAPAV
ncbi:MAG: DUF6261 family protein [Paludibacter sp.]